MCFGEMWKAPKICTLEHNVPGNVEYISTIIIYSSKTGGDKAQHLCESGWLVRLDVVVAGKQPNCQSCERCRVLPQMKQFQAGALVRSSAVDTNFVHMIPSA